MSCSRARRRYAQAGSNTDIVIGYAAFLRRQRWSWWCHLTFRRSPSYERANRVFMTWLHHINRKTCGNNYYKRAQGLLWVRGTELQQRGARHFHALIAGCANLSIEDAVADWKKMAGDGKISTYDEHKGAVFYIAKVYAGGQRGDLDFGGPWTQLPANSQTQSSALG